MGRRSAGGEEQREDTDESCAQRSRRHPARRIGGERRGVSHGAVPEAAGGD